MNSYIDIPARKSCYATLWSFGEICVGCGCCSKDRLTRTKARLKYWEWYLDDSINFDRWVPGWEELQKKHIRLDIKKAKSQIKYYKKQLISFPSRAQGESSGNGEN